MGNCRGAVRNQEGQKAVMMVPSACSKITHHLLTFDNYVGIDYIHAIQNYVFLWSTMVYFSLHEIVNPIEKKGRFVCC